eukprot:Skav204716  [mRNA]  locus=scaffold1549:110677:114585:- [translate_table: standard]
MIKCFRDLRIFRPRFALLENVKGLKTHPHYPILQQVIRWCGYEIRHECVMDLAQVAPVSRTRFLMVLQRMEDQRTPFVWHSWTPRNDATLLSWDVISETPKHELPTWLPNHDALLKYWEPKYLPNLDAESTIRQKRIPDKTAKLPVMMASFGAQHEIKEQLLQEKGLQGVFVMENQMCRWFKPTELTVAHQQLQGQILLKPARTAWHAIGNMIATPHAMLALSNWAIHVFDHWDDARMKMVFQQAFQNKLMLHRATVVEDEHAWYLGQPHEIARCRETLHHFLANMNDGHSLDTWKEGHYLSQQGEWMPFPATPHSNEDQSLEHCRPELSDHQDQPVPPTELDEPQEEDTPCKRRKTEDERNHDNEFCCIKLQLPNVSDVALLAHSDVMWHDVLDHWNIEMKIKECTTHARISPESPMQSAILEYCKGTADLSTQPSCSPNPIMFWTQGNKAVALPIKGSVQDMIDRHPVLTDAIQDVYGQLSHAKTLNSSVFLNYDNGLKRIPNIDEFLPSLQAVVCETCVPCSSDTLVVGFSGKQHHLQHVTEFWQLALTQEWLQQYSRHMHMEVVNSQYLKLHFVPIKGQFPCPVELFKRTIMIRMLQVALHSFAQPTGVNIRFKIQGRTFATVIMDPAQDIWPLMILTRHVMAMYHHGMQPTFISAGKRWADQHKVRDMATAQVRLDPTNFACTVVEPLLGGANHTRDDMLKQIHSGFATLFIDHGFDVQKVPSLVTNMIQQIGTTRAMHVIFSEPYKSDKFKELCQLCNISIPEASQSKSRKTKQPKLDTNKASKPVTGIEVSQYKLAEGFFLLQDGNAAPIQEAFTPQKTGIAMVNLSQAEPWLVSPPILADELALFIVGDIPEPVATGMEHRVVPALNAQGQKVLIGGYVKQLGEKQIVFCDQQHEKIPVQNTTVCSFTVWADEFTSAQWQDLAASPVRYVRQILKREGNDALGIPWGRTYKDGKTSTTPQNAKSIQFHAELPTDNLTEILKTSGYNKVYITPKSTTGKPDAQWRVIWHDQPPEVLQAQAMQLTGSCGLIRGLKSRGIRVREDAFDSAWKQLHPDMPPPQRAPQGDLYKIWPFPFGTSADSIRSWAEHQKWQCHPIKMLGPKTWLVVTQQPLPQHVLSFNGGPLITKLVKPHQADTASGLVAGPRSKTAANKSEDSVPDDAWMEFRQRQGMTIHKPLPSAASSSSGPTTKHLEMQDNKIRAMEQAFTQLQTEMRDTAKSQDHKLEHMDRLIKENSSQTVQALQGIRQDFDATLTKAMNIHDQRLTTAMGELKNLFTRREKRRQAEPNQSDMESDS